jgi:Protein of unknown function (DUF2591)
MQVSELDGHRLDYWVARMLKLNGVTIENERCWAITPTNDEDEPPHVELFSPSTAWKQGVPVIDALNISVVFEPDSAADVPSGTWIAYIQPVEDTMFWGATPLHAAMRAAVHRRFGHEVPD